MIRKAIRIRRKLFALAATKKASIRQVAELPPEMPLSTAFTVNSFRLCRILILRPFCPCCFAKYSWKDILCPKTSCFGRLCYEGLGVRVMHMSNYVCVSGTANGQFSNKS